jgi:glycine dehydrogenase subunit 1
MMEVGETIMARACYAARMLDRLPGVRAPVFRSAHFREFVVDFSGTGKTVSEINQGLLARGIFGGKDLSREFPELGQSALYCVTEVHTQADILRLVEALKEVLQA